MEMLSKGTGSCWLFKEKVIFMKRYVHAFSLRVLRMFVFSLRVLFVYMLFLCAVPMRVHALQAELPPHLIQTVGEQEIYEGLLALGMLECPVAEEADCGKAYENIKNCVVRIQMGNAHGSGIIWKLTPERVVIATNRHVLDYWEETDSYVYFPQGYYTDAQILGVSKKVDAGFLAVDNTEFTYEELKKLRSAHIDETVYDRLKPGDAMFMADAGSEMQEAGFYEAVLEERQKYIADFGADMLYGKGFAKAGMSGGGTFDGYGNLIGMTTGGTVQNEVAAVTLPDLVRVYEEIVQEDTAE